MRLSNKITLTCMCIALSGCQPKPSSINRPAETHAPPETARTQKPTETVDQENNSKPPVGSPNKTKNAGKDQTQVKKGIPDSAFAISSAKKEGWQKSRLSITMLAENLDRSITNLSRVEGNSTLLIKNQELEGMIKGEISIQDKDNVMFEYATPSQPVNKNVMLIEKGEQAIFKEDRWAPFKPRNLSPQKLAKEWPSQFPELLGEAICNKNRLFKPLFETLPKQGYSLTAEERTLTYQGRQQTYYRVIARQKDREMEMRFHGIAYVPLVVKVNGPKSNAQWQVDWAFNEKPKIKRTPFPKKVFVDQD